MPQTYGRRTLGSTGVAIQVTADGSPEWKSGGVTIDWATVTAEASDRTLGDGTVIKAGAKGLEFGTVLCAIAIAEVQTVTVNGSPTGGTYTLKVTGGTVETPTIAYNAAASAVQAAIRTLGGSYAQAVVAGSAGGPYTVTFPTGSGDVTVLVIGTNGLTGGSSPTVAVTTPTAGTGPGTYGPYSSTATDGRQNLVRGRCFILNETVTELGPLGLATQATDHPGVFEGGRVWRARLKIGGDNPTSIGGLQPTLSAFETAFPRIRFVDL
jgi:hypothetical protein